MLGGNNPSPSHPVFLDESRFQYRTNASNQLQMIGNLPAGCNVNPVNFLGNEHATTPISRTNKRGREMEDISRQQKLENFLNYNICKDEAHLTASIPNQNPVSTGLRLSYDDDEHNLSVTCASRNMVPEPSIILSLGHNIKTELDRQKEDFDRFIRIQDKNLMKGVREMEQRHMASFLSSIEKGATKKLLEKDQELVNINCKNKQLVDRMKQMAMEAQNWHYRAKYTESVVNLLKSNLQQALSQGPDRGKEGFGDSEVDDAMSNNYQAAAATPIARNIESSKERVLCRECKAKEACVVLTPCRHLCLCKECDVHVNVCPVCKLMKTASYQVFLS